jgi:hypothetical protein
MGTSSLRIATIAVAGTVTAGLLAFPVASFAAGSDDAVKRDEDTPDVVLVADDDDDDTNANRDGTNTGTGTNGNTGTGTNTGGTNTGTGTGSGDQNDPTNSRVTDVSRDNDLSRSDKTRDWTRDGAGDRTRDWSQNLTNDASRNDTRG